MTAGVSSTCDLGEFAAMTAGMGAASGNMSARACLGGRQTVENHRRVASKRSFSDMSDAEDTSEVDLGTHRFSVEETVVIFDWDDTFLPSSWIQEQGLRLDEESVPTLRQHEQLSELAHLAAETLNLAKQLGTILLITNAERNWIEQSCAKFMPSLCPSLRNVKLLSARTEYETKELSSPYEWKLRAFENEISNFWDRSSSVRKNIVSLGDSSHERDALIHATTRLTNCCTKSLKFVERPGVEQLRKQHKIVGRIIRHVVHHEENLHLSIGTM